MKTKPAQETVPPLELILASGDRLRIPHDARALKVVLAVLREQAWSNLPASVRVYLCTSPCDSWMHSPDI